MKRTKQEIEHAKALFAQRMKKRTEEKHRITVYIPVSVSIAMREKLRRDRDALSNYIVRLIERDLNK